MSHITTRSGTKFNPLDEHPAFDMHDIAHALAHINRFNGHSTTPWSVGQHSICCSLLIPESAHRREALMHDAHEAYLCDVPTPLKAILPDYRGLEQRLERKLRAWAKLPPTMSSVVASADRAMLIAEAYLFHPKLWIEMERPTVFTLAVRTIEQYFKLPRIAIRDEFLALAGAQ